MCREGRGLVRYGSHATVDAAKRKLLLYSLWLSAGRTNECCFLSFDSLRLDAHFRAVQVEIIQFKTSKAKKVAFMAGPNADRCWFTHLGDMLAMDRVPTHRLEYANLMFSDYQGKAPNQGVGRIIKDMNFRDNGANEKFRAIANAAGVDLPAGAAAAGIRQGACTELSILPVHQAIATSGHEMGGICKYYEYVQSTMANYIIGAQVLAGWPAPTHGHPTRGSRPASLDTLTINAVVPAVLDKIIDATFYLDNSRQHVLPKKVPDGELGAGMPGALRPAVRAAIASVVMHYKARHRDSQMPAVQARLGDAVKGMTQTTNPRAKLEEWGGWIRKQFDLDNLHLTTLQEVVGIAGLADVVARLGSNLGDVSGTAQNKLAAVVAKLTGKQHQLAAACSQLAVVAKQLMTNTVNGKRARGGARVAQHPTGQGAG